MYLNYFSCWVSEYTILMSMFLSFGTFHKQERVFPITTCYNFSDEDKDTFYAKASAVNTGDRCIVLYDSDGCKGKSYRLYPEGAEWHSRLGTGQDNNIRTFSSCYMYEQPTDEKVILILILIFIHICIPTNITVLLRYAYSYIQS